MPKIQNKDQKKKDILEAAMKAYAKYGIENTKVQDISDIAGIGKGTIYEYFSSKEELFFEAVTHLGLGLPKGLKDMLQNFEKDPFSALNKYVDGVISTALNEREKLYLLMQFGMSELFSEKNADEAKDLHTRFSKPFNEEYKVIIKKCIQSGKIKTDLNEEEITYISNFLVSGFIFESITTDKKIIGIMGNYFKKSMLQLYGFEYSQEK